MRRIKHKPDGWQNACNKAVGLALRVQAERLRCKACGRGAAYVRTRIPRGFDYRCRWCGHQYSNLF